MQKGYFNMGRKASPSPSEGGDVFPQTLLSIEKKPLPQPTTASPSPSEGGDVFPQALRSIKKKPLPQPHLQPHPQPLSEWRGE